MVVGCFVATRVAYALAGVGFDASALHPTAVRDVQWQLLPLRLLRHHLLSSVWNLHSQPPLYNLACGLLLQLPPDVGSACAAVAFAVLGAAMVSTTFLLLTELGVDVRAAVAVTVVVVADPAAALYEHWLSWSYPTGTALTAGTYCLVRYARTRNGRWAALSSAAFATVVLVDSTFQWPWLLVATVIIVVAGRPRWRAAVRAAAVPAVIVAGWYVKDAAQFGTAATSSWLGMNLWQSTLAQAPPADVQRLIGQGTLSPLAAREPFESVSAYRPELGPGHRTGVPALDIATSELGVPNFDNIAYIAVSGRYLSDDLAYIRARPARYGRAVTMSLELWSIPADQYVWPERDSAALAGYSRLFDRSLLLQPGYAGEAIVRAEFTSTRPAVQQLSWTVIVMTLIGLLLAPVALARRRRDRRWLAAGTLMWTTLAYSLVVTSCTELGENMRFRFELGTLPVVLAAATVAALLRRPPEMAGDRQQPDRADRQVGGGDERGGAQQAATGGRRRGKRPGQADGQPGDAGGDRGEGDGRPGVVVEVGEHERLPGRITVDTSRAQRRPGDERHDLVGVTDERFEQPATEGRHGAGDQGGPGVVVARDDQAGGQRQGGPDEQPGGRGGDEQEVQVRPPAPVPDMDGQRGQVGAQPDGQHGRSRPGQGGQPDQEPGREEADAAGNGAHRQAPGQVPAGHVGQEEHRPQLLGHRHVRQPQPGEQPDRGVGQDDVAGQVEPGAPPVRHVEHAEAGGGDEADHGEAQTGDRGAPAPDHERPPDVGGQADDGHGGHRPSRFDHRLPPGGQSEGQ